METILLRRTIASFDIIFDIVVILLETLETDTDFQLEEEELIGIRATRIQVFFDIEPHPCKLSGLVP